MPDLSPSSQSVRRSTANRRLLLSSRAKKGRTRMFVATLARAKRLDARGNREGCTEALSAAKDMYNL